MWQASWASGNSDGTGTAGNPSVDNVDILYLLEDPVLKVEIGDLPDIDYCGSGSPETVLVTVTNTGGPARNLQLALGTSGADATFLPSSGWTVMGSSVISYSGGTVLKRNETATFSLDVLIDSPVCAGGDATVSLTPSFSDACELLFQSSAAGESTVNLGGDSPTLVVTKVANGATLIPGPDGDVAVYRPGDTASFDINVSGTNGDNIELKSIAITDIVPSVSDHCDGVRWKFEFGNWQHG